MATQQTQTRYIPVSKFDQYQPWPTPQSIRNRINAARRRENPKDPDFLKCIKFAGGRVLVDEQAFLKWIESQHSGSGQTCNKVA